MSTPNFSPISTFQHRKAAGSLTRKAQHVSASDGSNRPKYQCPGCNEVFAKWSPCLAHLRENKHVAAELLDKKLNGGDFRRIQEMCATLAYRFHAGSGGRDRAESISSVESLSSDSGGEEEENLSVSAGGKKTSSSKQKIAPVSSSLAGSLQKKTNSTRVSRKVDIRRLDEKIIFRILTFLDVDSSRMLFLAMTVAAPERPSSAESRVRLWSVSSDPDSVSLPSSSPPSGSKRFQHPVKSKLSNA